MEYIKLYNGVQMPTLGYGVFLVSPDECERCVSDALSVGYRLIDTAQAYQNEEGVGNAWRKSGIKREDLFLPMLVKNRLLRASTRVCASCRRSTLICYSSIRPTATYSAHGGLWRRLIVLARCAPSASATFRQAVSSTLPTMWT